MTVTSLMYDGGSYAHGQFANLLSMFLRTGYVKGFESELAVSATTPIDMAVTVGTGRARIKGYWYKNAAIKELVIGEADETNPRIDRVVLRLNLSAYPRKITAVILKGEAAASPAAPVLTQTSTIHEIGLARVYVDAGAVNIDTTDITDERDDYSACGVATTYSALVGNVIPPTAAIDMEGMKVTNLPPPGASSDIARMAYYDSVIGSMLGTNKFEIAMVFGTIPTGWLELNGQAVSRATYPQLFAAWGTTFGTGDGSTTFNLPDLRGRLIYGATTTIGTKGGVKTVTLTLSTMASHAHGGAYPATAADIFTIDSGGGSYAGGSGPNTSYADPQGGGGSHTNLSPYLVLRFMVRGS